MGSRYTSIAWKVILIADLGVLLYGLMALLSPEVLGAGFESYTGQSLSALFSTNPKIGEYFMLLGRLVGAFNVAFSVGAIAIILASFRKGATWSWIALLLINTIGYVSPIVFDQIVGSIGIFEQLEIVFLLLIYLMLGVSARDVLKKNNAWRYI